jgi:clorobiocin biosynthesis protein CloN6
VSTGEYGVLPGGYCKAILETIDQTQQLLGEMERALELDGELPPALRNELLVYNRKILAYTSDQIVPVPRPFGGRWFDDATVPKEMIQDVLRSSAGSAHGR